MQKCKHVGGKGDFMGILGVGEGQRVRVFGKYYSLQCAA